MFFNISIAWACSTQLTPKAYAHPKQQPNLHFRYTYLALRNKKNSAIADNAGHSPTPLARVHENNTAPEPTASYSWCCVCACVCATERRRKSRFASTKFYNYKPLPLRRAPTILRSRSLVCVCVCYYLNISRRRVVLQHVQRVWVCMCGFIYRHGALVIFRCGMRALLFFLFVVFSWLPRLLVVVTAALNHSIAYGNACMRIDGVLWLLLWSHTQNIEQLFSDFYYQCVLINLIRNFCIPKHTKIGHYSDCINLRKYSTRNVLFREGRASDQTTSNNIKPTSIKSNEFQLGNRRLAV